MMLEDEESKYMARCLQLAALGRGHTAPNPMVGAVVVHQGRIIGEGYHRRCGEAHAEVNAIASVKDPSLLGESTIYVSLEPCSHWGKTPPCSKLIIEKGIPRVVVGIQDPFAKVAGRGIKMLREAGVDVKVGVLEAECAEINRPFFTVQEKGRPYVILKWAQSSDGFIDVHRTAGDGCSAVRISDTLNGIAVHKLRAEVDAILVGTNTALLDRPSLTVRAWSGSNPLRVVLDRRLRIVPDNPLLDGSTPTLVVSECSERPVEAEGLEYMTLPFGDALLPALLAELARRGVQTLLVEGGAEVLNSFIIAGLWDEARIEIGAVCLGDGVRAPALPSGTTHTAQLGASSVTRVLNC
jgi:diaminohydroxyphosphoribosylaminopyrimidine deaminase/5-amino-6-(5-phosphoribosylamino)uracil reductase